MTSELRVNRSCCGRLPKNLSSTSRSSALELWFFVSQREEESGACAACCFGPDATAVSRDYALHYCEADPCTFKLRVPMHPLKRSEEFFRACHVEPGTVVPHVEDSLLLLDLMPKCDASFCLFCGVFPRIAQQIHQDNRHEACVRACAKTVGDIDGNLTSRVFILEIGDHAVRNRRQIDHLLPERSAAEP